MPVKMFFVGNQNDRYPVLAVRDSTGANLTYIPETVDENILRDDLLEKSVDTAEYAIIITDGNNPGIPKIRKSLEEIGVNHTRTYSHSEFSISRHYEVGKINYVFVDAKMIDAVDILRRLSIHGEEFLL